MFSVFVHQPGNKENVVESRQDGEEEDRRIDRGKVISRVIRHAGGKHDDSNGDYLDCGVEFPQKRRPKPTKPGHDIYGRRSHDYENVPADYGYCDPEGNRQMARQRLRKDAAHGEDNKGRHHHEFVGDWVEDGAELRLLLKPASQQAVKAVCESREDKHRQSQDKSLIEEQGYENGNQHHPEDGEHVGDSYNPGGWWHQSVNRVW